MFTMKKLVISVALTALLLACTGGNGSESARPRADSADDSLQLVQRVKDIYSAVFDRYEHSDSLFKTSADANVMTAMDSLYCSEAWNALVARVMERDRQVFEREGLMGFFDADYWIMGQDWQDLGLSRVRAREITDSTAVVDFLLHNCGEEIPVSLDMVRQDGRWLIDNFFNVRDDFSFKDEMLQYVEPEVENQ